MLQFTIMLRDMETCIHIAPPFKRKLLPTLVSHVLQQPNTTELPGQNWMVGGGRGYKPRRLYTKSVRSKHTDT